MSQPLEWKEYQGKQHVYWSMYKQFGNADLVSKFKGTGDGYNPANYGPFELEGYVYSAVSKKSRDGTKTYFDIERVPKSGAAQPTATSPSQFDQRQDQIQRNFQERLKFDEKRLSFDRENGQAMMNLAKALTELNSTTLGLLSRVEATYDQLEILVKTLIDRKDLFQPASNLTSQVNAD